ncbi:MAG: VOC family protein [Mesorhizobium sp.]|nr:VOC family protein [Mesorhizobium sp.]MCO5160234.1 VOC family protein [Mesorhizobium sp.]
MIHIDHVCLGTQNVYEGSYRLMNETGLGCYEGGWFPKLGLANRIFPTGGDTYIEVESAVDIHAYEAGNPAARFFHDQCVNGDVFIGWCARVDTRNEIEQIARRLGSDVVESGLRQRPDGTLGVAIRTPDTIPCWEAGLPNFFLVVDPSKHPGRGVARHGSVDPKGIAWLELGGTEEELSDYLGIKASELGLRFNGKAHGLHAMGIATDRGDIVVRRDVITGTTGKVGKLTAYI